MISDKLASFLTYLASGVSIMLGFMNQNAAALGVLIALCTFLLNWYYKVKQLKQGKVNGNE